MNYTTYKIKSKIKMYIEKLESIVFFIPRYIYKNSEIFRNYMNEKIQNHENKKYVKGRNKRMCIDLFKMLDRKDVVLVLDDFFFRESFCDLTERGYGRFLEDEKWVKKNNLKVEKYLIADYAHAYYVDKFKTEDSVFFKLWTDEFKESDRSMYVVTKLKPTF